KSEWGLYVWPSACNINDELVGQPVSSHPCAGWGRGGGGRVGVTPGAGGLPPVHAATDLSPPGGGWKVNAEMTSNFREGGDFVASNNHCRLCHHFPPMEGAICSCFTPSDGALHGEHRFKVLKPSVDLCEHFESPLSVVHHQRDRRPNNGVRDPRI